MRQAQRPRSSHLVLQLTLWTLSAALPTAAQTITPAAHRHSPTDLELTGLLPGLPPGASRFLTARQLASLPQTAFDVTHDDNLPGPPVHVEGIPLTVLREALGIPPAADLIDALCTDQYRTYYPADYLAAHHPLLALTINGQSPAVWAAAAHARNPGPYFITHDHFVPAFHVLSHQDEPQIPTNVTRLNFTTAHAFGPITSPVATLEVAQGFTIAKQNCLRCHFSGDAGGAKSGRDWQILSLWARQKPDYFTGYVHNPKSKDPHSQMPAFPEYDEATLNALLAYFRSFPAK